MKASNVSNILRLGCCTACGACSNVCPKDCLATEYDEGKGLFVTHLDESNCIDCGRCTKVCPVMTWDNSDGRYLGKYVSIYAGHTADDTYRMDCASGGMTTALLCYLLKTGEIDAVVSAVRKEGSPLLSEYKISYTIEEIKNTKGSVYSPTSLNEIIGQIRQAGDIRFAIVGLPCHIEAIHNLCKADKAIGRKIAYKISLVCGHTPSNNAYKYSLSKLGIALDRVKYMRNRGGGWPGFLTFGLEGKVKKCLEHGSRYSWGQTLGSPLFTPSGCKHCSDATGYKADVSICDAWMPKYKDDTKGVNLLIARNEKICCILEEMRAAGIVTLCKEDEQSLMVSNGNVFKEKLYINAIRNATLQKKYKLYPEVKYATNGMLSSIFIGILMLAEKAFAKLGWRQLNDAILFGVKLTKYLAIRCIRIRKY